MGGREQPHFLGPSVLLVPIPQPAPRVWVMSGLQKQEGSQDFPQATVHPLIRKGTALLCPGQLGTGSCPQSHHSSLLDCIPELRYCPRILQRGGRGSPETVPWT